MGVHVHGFIIVCNGHEADMADSPDPAHYTSTAVLAILRGSVCQKTIYQPDGAVKKELEIHSVV